MHETKKAIAIIDGQKIELEPGTCLVINDTGEPIIMKSFIFIGEPTNKDVDSVIGVVRVSEETLGSYVFQIQNRAFNVINEREREQDQAVALAQALSELAEDRDEAKTNFVPNSPFN